MTTKFRVFHGPENCKDGEYYFAFTIIVPPGLFYSMIFHRYRKENSWIPSIKFFFRWTYSVSVATKVFFKRRSRQSLFVIRDRTPRFDCSMFKNYHYWERYAFMSFWWQLSDSLAPFLFYFHNIGWQKGDKKVQFIFKVTKCSFLLTMANLQIIFFQPSLDIA